MKNPMGQNMGTMNAADRERSAKALRVLREQHERHIRAYNEHAAECQYCDREAVPGVVTYCRRGLELRDQRVEFGAVYRSSKVSLASFGVTE